MNSPEDPKLHAALRALEAPKAPRSLQAAVLARIAAEQHLPWWRREFSHWPLAARIAIPALSLPAIGGAVLAFQTGLGEVGASASAASSAAQARFGWLLTLADALREGAGSLHANLPSTTAWVGALLVAGVGASLLLTAAGGGLLMRLAQSRDA